jgi:CRP/FNR family transcriptional regulator
VDEVVFQRMDRRVASLLMNKSRPSQSIRMTHQEIAAELGSSREVISRILEGFAAAGGIRSVRGLVEILSPEYLHSLAAM